VRIETLYAGLKHFMPDTLSTYESEKEDGTRTATGAKKLLKLNVRHHQLIALHLSGMRNSDIAREMGVSDAWVSTLKRDPLVQEIIQQKLAEASGELAALLPSAVGVLRSIMQDSRDPVLQLSAADKLLRTQGYYDMKTKGAGPLTAEDIVQKLLEQTAEGGETSVSISVNRSGKGRQGNQFGDDVWREDVTTNRLEIDHDPLA
jgi:hypothetical protein